VALDDEVKEDEVDREKRGVYSRSIQREREGCWKMQPLSTNGN